MRVTSRASSSPTRSSGSAGEGRGRGRVAGELPALRHRLWRRIVGNLRRRPHLAAALPLMLAGFPAPRVALPEMPTSCTRTGPRRGRRHDDRQAVRHAGVGHRRRARPPGARARPAVLRRARLVIAPSTALAEEARLLGAREVRTIPTGVDLPSESPRRRSRRRSSTRAGSRPRRASAELVAAAEGCRSSSWAMVPAARRCRRRSGSSRMTSSSGCTGERRSSRARRIARASASSAPKRWRTGGRLSPGTSAVCAISSSTRRRGCSCRRRTSERCAPRSSACSATRSFAAVWGRPPDANRGALHVGALRRRTLRAYDDALVRTASSTSS